MIFFIARCRWMIAAFATLIAWPALAQTAVKIGVLNDQSGPYSEYTGTGSVDAARMAIEDFGGKALGQPIELVSGDHQNKPDTALSIAKRWLDTQGVDVIVDVPTSSVALAVQNLMREKRKIILFSGAGTSELTGKACSPYGIHWTYDSYAIAQAPVRAAMQSGLRNWYFLTVDFAFGHALQRDATAAIEAAGGKVLGAVRHPFNMPDFAAALLTAKNANADIIGLANAGPDMINSLKQAKEFGLPGEGQKIASLLMTVVDVHGLGLAVTQGALLTESFYSDMNEASRTWSKRFFERNRKMPTMIQAGVYGSVTHYLKAVAAVGSTDFGRCAASNAKIADQRHDDQGWRHPRGRACVARVLCVRGEGAGGLEGTVGLLQARQGRPCRGGCHPLERKPVRAGEKIASGLRQPRAARRQRPG